MQFHNNFKQAPRATIGKSKSPDTDKNLKIPGPGHYEISCESFWKNQGVKLEPQSISASRFGTPEREVNGPSPC